MQPNILGIHRADVGVAGDGADPKVALTNDELVEGRPAGKRRGLSVRRGQHHVTDRLIAWIAKCADR